MSDFNGKVFILSPDAEQKYNDNDEYAKNWLDASSAEEDRGLFAFYVKPGSGALSIIASEMLKKEKPFLTDDFFSLVLGKSDREKEFIELLKKHISEIAIEPSEATLEVVANAKSEREAQSEIALQLSTEIKTLTQKLAETKEVQAAAAKENELLATAQSLAAEERETLAAQSNDVFSAIEVFNKQNEILKNQMQSFGEQCVGQTEALGAAASERLGLEILLKTANTERLALTKENTDLKQQFSELQQLIRGMDQRLNDSDNSAPGTEPMTTEQIENLIATKLKEQDETAAAPGEETINADWVIEKIKELAGSDSEGPSETDSLTSDVSQGISEDRVREIYAELSKGEESTYDGPPLV